MPLQDPNEFTLAVPDYCGIGGLVSMVVFAEGSIARSHHGEKRGSNPYSADGPASSAWFAS
jgi:hypothetical protein